MRVTFISFQQKMMISICLLVFLPLVETLPRVRRQYWNDSPYFQGARYYEQEGPHWNTYQQSYQVYYPQQYGYQGNWQYAQQSSYVTAPPQPEQYVTPRTGGYSRPDYLQSRPTLPVVIERTTHYVTPRPLPSDRHPTFLERVISSGLPMTTSTSTDGFFDREKLPTRQGFFESAEISTSEPSTTESSEEITETTTETTTEVPTTPTTITPLVTTAETTTETTTEVTTAETTTETTTEVTTAETTTETTTEVATAETTTETTTEVTTTTTTEVITEPSTTIETSTTSIPTTESETTTTQPITTITPITKESQPVTLIATQNLDDSNENENHIDTDAAKTVFETATGIVGLRPPPLPKPADPDETESSGVEVVKWTDSDKKL